ncbi:MAG: mismatch-specific DNA-glycosylase [Planctomycetes bacterium]|nr:mismatch-specific DNA-glycosylase [Planctomycetota bacterium]
MKRRSRPFLRDLLRPGLRLVIVGFNPGAVSAARGHYYAKPGNQFYPLLAEVGLTPRPLSPDEDRTLPRFGIGLADLCPWRAGPSDILTGSDIRRGRVGLLAKLRRVAPRAVAFNGLTLFRHVFGRTPAPGLQPERIGRSFVFALPSTSGLVNGRWEERRAAFRNLARWLDEA